MRGPWLLLTCLVLSAVAVLAWRAVALQTARADLDQATYALLSTVRDCQRVLDDRSMDDGSASGSDLLGSVRSGLSTTNLSRDTLVSLRPPRAEGEPSTVQLRFLSLQDAGRFLAAWREHQPAMHARSIQLQVESDRQQGMRVRVSVEVSEGAG